MPKGVPNKRYTAEFKVFVIETMRDERLSYSETAQRFEVNSHHRIQEWERIYLTEGPEGFQIERRGRGSKGSPTALPKAVEEDLLAEVQRLRAENAYLISDRPVLSMVTKMLDKAFEKIPDGTNLILHSDQGWQYQHKQYQRKLHNKGVRQSMSRKGNCLDNAVIENFFGLLKSELLYLQEFEAMEQFKQELVEYLDYYNNRRIKAKLKGLPPALHRQQALLAA
jgi:transposase-like protein